MKIHLRSVGKPHESFVNEGIDLFTKRVARYFPVEWTLIAAPKNAASMEPGILKLKEGDLILAGLAKEDYLVLLDEKGKSFTSEAFSAFIVQRTNESIKNLVFLIGGAYGVSEAVRQRANFTWSLSPLVFPHQLVRLILAEQLYRACSIMKNEQYHHA
ncbi:MAG: 23S rRNA (pseudouridine(1915)-N(3))-methyltransferase RlmH [Ferruginibacter sp.]